MAVDPEETDPVDQTPPERGLERRGGGPAVGPWLVIAAIALLAALVYVISALRAG